MSLNLPLTNYPAGTSVEVMLANQAGAGAGVSIVATANPGTTITSIPVPGTGTEWGIISFRAVIGLQNSSASVIGVTMQIVLTQAGQTGTTNDVGTTPNVRLGATATANDLLIFRPYIAVATDGQALGVGASGFFLDTSQPFTIAIAAFASTTAVITAIPFGRQHLMGMAGGQT